MRDERFEMRVPRELLARVDEWRQEQTVPPTRAAAMRYLIEQGLKNEILVDQASAQAAPAREVATNNANEAPSAAR
jgi:hypothetical protein